jgi:hypothetical protein
VSSSPSPAEGCSFCPSCEKKRQFLWAESLCKEVLPVSPIAASSWPSLCRERRPARLVEAHAISLELVKKLLPWRHPGFSAHVGERIAPTDKLRPPGVVSSRARLLASRR